MPTWHDYKFSGNVSLELGCLKEEGCNIEHMPFSLCIHARFLLFNSY